MDQYYLEKCGQRLVKASEAVNNAKGTVSSVLGAIRCSVSRKDIRHYLDKEHESMVSKDGKIVFTRSLGSDLQNEKKVNFYLRLRAGYFNLFGYTFPCLTWHFVWSYETDPLEHESEALNNAESIPAQATLAIRKLLPVIYSLCAQDFPSLGRNPDIITLLELGKQIEQSSLI